MSRSKVKFSKVKLNHHQVSEILTSNGMVAALDEKGQEILEKVKDLAPVRTGKYKESLHLEHDVTDRAVVRIVSDVDYALAVEADQAPMGKAAIMSKEG